MEKMIPRNKVIVRFEGKDWQYVYCYAMTEEGARNGYNLAVKDHNWKGAIVSIELHEATI